jgi:DNA helicase-2/ATP-dependent DNA helicase PcrA
VRTRSQARAAAREKQTRLPVDFLAGLNPEQAEVVRYDGGPLRVLALAGSGKTESLGRLIARLVAERGVDPSRILAVTFSKKGADEMSARISKKLGVSGARVGTWHSLCYQIIREDRLPEATWKIEDSGPGTSATVVLKDVLGWKGMDWKGADLSAVERFISWCKAHLWEPDSAEAMGYATRAFRFEAGKATRAFHLYNEALQEKGLLTYDDYLVVAARHLRSDEEVRASWASRWDYVLQDEKQDANLAQDVIAELLARDHRNYVVIGDCYQAIYGFRGSSPEYLARFDQDWPGARTVVLPRNYRCGRRIIDAANRIVALAEVDGIDVPTQMIGERDVDGEVRVLCAESLDDEGNAVAHAIEKSVAAGDSTYADHTILFRTNAQSRAVEESLLKLRIPYVVVGGVSFYERKEVRDLLAYLRLAARRGGVDDVKRSINTPFRFLGAKFVERVMHAVEDAEDVSDWTGIVDRVAAGERLQERQRYSAREWAGMVRLMQTRIEEGAAVLAAAEKEGRPAEEVSGIPAVQEARPAALLEHVVKMTRYIDYLNKEEGGETTADSGAANVREMVRVAERFQTSGELLDYIDDTIKSARRQREDKQAGGERVLLMSVHRSKGLEWPTVYVVGMNEMVLPHVKGDPQEERRLAYVAATRARDVLVLSHVRRIATRAGIKDVEPSRFLRDTGLSLDIPGEIPEVAEPAPVDVEEAPVPA